MPARLLAILFTFFFAGAAIGEDIPGTVGELTGKGGTQVNAEELKALLAGATVSGTQMTTTTKFKNTYGADGTIDGTAITEGAAPISMKGNWSVVLGGAVINDFRPSTGRAFQSKAYWYKLDGKYFQAGGTAPYEKLMPREVNR